MLTAFYDQAGQLPKMTRHDNIKEHVNAKATVDSKV